MLTLVAFIVVIGILILVHEAGHFFAAKAVGIQVLRFSLGFGPPLLKAKRGETEYWLCAIPLGGYVKMAGLEEEGIAGELEGGKAEVAVDPARAFDRKPIWARLLVMVAGVAMNVVLAFVLYTGVSVALGSPELATTRVDSVNTARLPVGAEALASLRFGDRITRVNGDTVRTWNDFARGVLRARDSLRIDIAGRAEPLAMALPDSLDRRTAAQAIGPLLPPRIGIIEPGRPAARAGLLPDDLVLRANGDTVRSWNELVRAIRSAPGSPLRFDVDRRGQRLGVEVVPDSQTETDPDTRRLRVYGQIGAYPNTPTLYVRESFGGAVQSGVRQTAVAAGTIVVFLKQLFTGERSVRELGGPILIGQISGQVARLGLDTFLMFLAFFSVQLAVLNILPIPVLDGGHVVFLVAEAVRGKPVPLVWRIRLLNIGFWILVGIMLLALGNDVLRFFR
jgi:regulator of sigma E protease